MLGIFTADLSRIFTRVPRLLIYAAFAVLVVMNPMGEKGTDTTLKLINYGMDFFFALLPLMLGLLDFVYSFCDDMDNNVFVTIIGRGMKRGRYAAMKLLEAMVIFTLDMLLLNVLTWILCQIGQINPAFMSLSTWGALNLLVWIKTMIAMAIGSIFVFASGKMIAGSVAFIAVSSGTAELFASNILRLPLIANLHIEEWLPDALTNSFISKIHLGMIDWTAAAVLLGIFVVCAGAGIAVFKGRELEF